MLQSLKPRQLPTPPIFVDNNSSYSILGGGRLFVYLEENYRDFFNLEKDDG